MPMSTITVRPRPRVRALQLFALLRTFDDALAHLDLDDDLDDDADPDTPHRAPDRSDHGVRLAA
jgi:hypothetical protein